MSDRMRLILGNVLETPWDLPDRSVQCVVTSPPYWSLRDYQVEGQLGSEKTPDCLGWATGYQCGECFVCRMAAVFREVWRVLRDDGTLWLNLGDTYSSQPATTGISYRRDRAEVVPCKRPLAGMKPKNLCGIPWRVALALQADGWYLRQNIVWHKSSGMPESVQDRPSTDHEFLFLLTKRATYFYDAEAIMEPVSQNTYLRVSQNVAAQVGSLRANAGQDRQGRPMKCAVRSPKQSEAGSGVKNNDSFANAVCLPVSSRNKRSVWTLPNACSDYQYCGACKTFFDRKAARHIIKIDTEDDHIRQCPNCGSTDGWVGHFATFPEELVEPCILAGTSEYGACPDCGAPWTRVVEKGEPDIEHQRLCGSDAAGEYDGSGCADYKAGKAQDPSEVKANILRGMRERVTTRWEPTCKCGNPDTVPCVVLDPFSGSGTTGLVALKYGRHYVGIDLNPDYLEISRNRLAPTLAQPLLL